MMINKVLLTALALGLAGCASQSKNTTAPEAVTYHDRVQTVRASQLKANAECPADSAFEKETWTKQVAMANACVRLGDFARVEKLGDRLATKAPQTPWGPYFLGLAAGQRKDFARERWMLELALKKAPNEGLLHFELARLNWQSGQENVALSEMKRASDLNPSLMEAHLTLGQIAASRGDLSEARKYLDRAEAVDNQRLELLLTRADVEVRGQNFARAEHYLAQAVSHYPMNSKARVALAQIQEQHLNKSADALNNYRQIKVLAAQSKLDGAIPNNLDRRIQALEKTLSQLDKTGPSRRQPSAER